MGNQQLSMRNYVGELNSRVESLVPSNALPDYQVGLSLPEINVPLSHRMHERHLGNSE